VFISGFTDETFRNEMLAQGAVEYLFKPFSEAALLTAINAALGVS
jgi:FixJ family two-component response regulator